MGEFKVVGRAAGSGAFKELDRAAGSGAWKTLEWESAYEDFTTFTEVDVGADRIQKTANHIDHNAFRNEDTYLYKDYGVAHFGDFTHKIKAKMVAGSAAGSLGVVWALANDLDDIYGLFQGGKTSISGELYHDSGNQYVYMREMYDTHQYTDLSVNLGSVNVWKYIKFVKSGTAFNIYIYSNSDYTGLLDTLTRTLHGNWSFKYLYACNTLNTGDNINVDNDIENFDLGE